MIRSLLVLLTMCLLSPHAWAQQPVRVGKGSYADTPPANLVVDRKRNADLVQETEQRKLYLVDPGADRPIPSNKWFQSLLFHPYGTGLWAMPHKVDATAEGLEIFHPTTPSGDGTRLTAEFPLVVTGRDFKPVDSRAKDWADWTVSFRSFESDARYIEVTLGEGMPFVWCEFKGIRPLLALGGNNGKGSRGKTEASFVDLAGKPLQFPATADAIGLTYEGRHYGVFGPDGTVFTKTPQGVEISFAGPATYLVIAPLPAIADLSTFHRYAFAIPRKTELSWAYDRNAGTLSTTWKVTAEPLKGTSRAVLQGWLPHHWRETTTQVDFTDVRYTTIRGPLKCAAGENFTFSYPFNGVLPNLPAAAAPDFDAGRIRATLAGHFAEPKQQLGTDTYWGGKSLQQYAQAAFVAKQLNDPSADAIAAKLRSSLENWLTYTPGEKDRFFAYYPKRRGLVGFNVAYGSQHFTDHHFHLGYFAFAAGMLSQLQPDFAAQYGEIARLVTRSYANYDRADGRFPFFRTFDLWRGHSFADGNGFPDGNNQESTGEAVNSWAGMILLGEALGDEAMTAAGVMGYTFETRANVEYWFDPHGDVFPANYAHNACGMIWSGSIVWGTWFTASPAWIYGIQWIPSGPHAAFYDRDRNFIARTHADAIRELEAFEVRESQRNPKHVRKPATIAALGGELASYHLGFLMHADAAGVVNQLDQLHADPADKVSRDPWMAATYYQAKILSSLGRVDFTAHGTSPTSMVYQHPKTGIRTLIAWNPTANPQTVTFHAGGTSIGTLTVAPHAMGHAVLK